jgi:hypothetical protein
LGFFGLIGYCLGWSESDPALDDGCHCGCYQCFLLNMTCNDCNGNGGGDAGGILIVILLIFILIFAILGVFFGIIIGGVIVRKSIKRHTNKLWLRQETKKYVVKDFTERMDELQNISTQRSVINSSTQNTIDNNGTRIQPSAPLELSPVTTLKNIIN